tara:strand:+ start:630 stop:1397 length:768 start_codon:yes stop_codon:yes gene_type:complete
MTYFLGRDVEVYLTTESATAPSGGNACSIVVDTVSGAKLLRSDDGGSEDPVSGSMIPQMAFAAAVSGSVLDLTGIDLSIGVSDEDVGPFLGAPQIMQKVELRKETVVTLTRKKSDNFFDVIFNGPVETGSFIQGNTADAKRMGARYGLQFEGASTAKIGDGQSFMKDVPDLNGSTNCCYGYRIHMVLKPSGSASEEVFVVKNAAMTGHTVTLNADGVQEESIEFTSSVAPEPFVPTAAVGSDGWSDFTPTAMTEL